MLYPKLRPMAQHRQMCSAFLGLDCTSQAATGAFYDMENLTSDHFPAMASRQPRQLYADTNALGLIAGNVMVSEGGKTHPVVQLCYVDARSQKMVVGDQVTRLTVALNSHKWLVSMGAYVLVFPDKKYINTLNTEDYGSMEAFWQADSDLELVPCDAFGEPGTGCYRVEAPGIDAGFSQGDVVQVTGVTLAPQLNASARICKVGGDMLVLEGNLEAALTLPMNEHHPFTLFRSVPDMDFVIECGNRLWGCRYGVNADGEVENRIFCCKLGDFKNWQVYQGVSTDAWSATVGSDGPFTGAIAYRGNPLFFKENCLHKVYIGDAGDHQILDTSCRGVQLHCGKSLAVVGDALYYKSPDGVMTYDGAFPRSVSDKLGRYRFCGNGATPASMHNGQFIHAVGGCSGSKYYLSLSDEKRKFQLLVYDTRRDLWHREDNLQLVHACSLGTHLYAVDSSGDIWRLDGDGDGQPVAWYAVTGDLGLDSPDKKYISRLTLRLQLSAGSQMTVEAQYDHSGIWEPLYSGCGDGLGSIPVSVQPRRCDHLRLRLRGQGEVKLYSLTKTLSEGSDHR